MWSYDPAVLTEYTAEAEAAAFLEALPSDAARREVLVHVYCWGGNCIDISRSDTKYTNHSSSPNTGSNPNGEDGTYALRDIACGEEITEDYGTYASPWAIGSSPYIVDSGRELHFRCCLLKEFLRPENPSGSEHGLPVRVVLAPPTVSPSLASYCCWPRTCKLKQ